MSGSTTTDLQPFLASRVNGREYAQLSRMPTEILLEIVYSLNVRDLPALARTSRLLASIVVPELDKSNARDGRSFALWYGCVHGSTAILRRQIHLQPHLIDDYFPSSFLDRKINELYGKDMTPLTVSILAGSYASVKWLLENGANVHKPDRTGVQEGIFYPIHWAAESNRGSSPDTINLLAEYSANMNQMILCKENQPHFYGYGAPLCGPLRLLRPAETDRRLIPTLCEEYNDGLKTLYALQLQKLRALLANGADASMPCARGNMTPLFFLMSKLSDYELNFRYSPVRLDEQAAIICQAGLEFLGELCDAGADIHALGNTTLYGGSEPFYSEETLLHAACRLHERCKGPVIACLLERGIDINGLSSSQTTPLMTYCKHFFNNIEMFCDFLKAGAGRKEFLNHQDNAGRTVLHAICSNSYINPVTKYKAVTILLREGANPAIACGEGFTAMDELKTWNTRNGFHTIVFKSIIAKICSYLVGNASREESPFIDGRSDNDSSEESSQDSNDQGANESGARTFSEGTDTPIRNYDKGRARFIARYRGDYRGFLDDGRIIDHGNNATL